MYIVAIVCYPFRFICQDFSYYIDRVLIYMHYIWAKGIIKCLGVNVRASYDVYDGETLRDVIKMNGAILVSNHPGTLDALIVHMGLPVYSLKTVFKWNLLYQPPFIGILMLLHRHIAVFKQDSILRRCLNVDFISYFNQRGLEILKQYKDYSDCDCLLIFPEGSRHEPTMDEPVNKFHTGAFHLAEYTRCPIIPVCIHGSNKVMNKKSFIPDNRMVKVHFDKPIYMHDRLGNKQFTINELSQEVRLRIRRLYEEMDKSG